MASILAGASNFTISGGTFAIHQEHSNGNGPTSAFDKLSQAAAHSALHDAPARTDESRCHQCTRIKVLDRLEHRVQSICNEEGSIFWLYGGAGAGKSAVMQTLAERCVARRLALGSFFFSRTDSTRNTAEVLVATLLYQVAQSFPTAMDILAPVVNRDPLVFKKSLQVQCRDLFVPTLQHLVQLRHISDDSGTPRVFLIDGLDECNGALQQQAIIREMATVCHKHHIPIHILIASRPEHTISTSFELYKQEHPGLGTMSLSEDADAEADIRRFVEDEFVKMRSTHPFRQTIPSEWPDQYDINRLAWKSSSHFIYASSAIKYIWTTKESPERSLGVILGLHPSRTTSPFAELDSLYHHILGSAAHSDQVRAILAHCVFSRWCSGVQFLCVMLECSIEDLSIFLTDMGPLLGTPPVLTRHAEVRFLHQSLRDFLCDKPRSGVLYLNQEAYFTSSLKDCFRILNLLSQNQYPTPGWAARDWTLDLEYLYGFLSRQIIDAAEKTLEISETQELLRQYTLDKFHECQLSLCLQHHLSRPHSSVGMPGFYLPHTFSVFEISNDLLFYLGFLISTKIKDGGFRLKSLEDFFDIFQSHLNLECKPLATVIFPLLFSGYSTTRICKILSTCCFTDAANPFCQIGYFHEGALLGKKAMSFVLMSSFRHFLPSFPFRTSVYITSSDLASIRHNINSSPPLLTEAAEAVLKYMRGFKPQWHSSHIRWAGRATPHKLWLQTKKPGKHRSIGSPRLASRFHRHCLDKNDHDDIEYILIAKPKYGKYLERIGLPTMGYWDWQRARNNNKFNPELLRALAWLLPKANHSESIILYSRRSLSQELFWGYPQLCRRLRRSLDRYFTLIQEELSDRIDEGDLDALIKKSQMLQLNALD